MQETVKTETQEVPEEMVELSEELKNLDGNALMYSRGFIQGMSEGIGIGKMQTAAVV